MRQRIARLHVGRQAVFHAGRLSVLHAVLQVRKRTGMPDHLHVILHASLLSVLLASMMACWNASLKDGKLAGMQSGMIDSLPEGWH
jgi:hypothetical protein